MSKVRIDNLRIRATGLSPEQARRLGEAVARRLSETLAPGRSQTIPALTVKVRGTANADEIAAQIGRKLK
jgi:5-carboxymethyl-2-hydroxymuconate isomerase